VTIRPKVVRPSRLWPGVLLLLVVLPLLPEIVVLGASAIDLSGCRVYGAGGRPTGDAQVPPNPGAYATRRPAIRSPEDAADQAGPGASTAAKGFAPAPGPIFGTSGGVCAIGPSVSSIIRLALNAAFLVGDAFSSGVVIIWLALCYVVITRGWTGFLARLTLALLVCLIFAFIPYSDITENLNCEPNDVAAASCIIYGDDVRSIMHQNVILRLRVVVGAPLAFGTFLLYLLFLPIAALVSRRAAKRSA
jgi:hypothetical protein